MKESKENGGAGERKKKRDGRGLGEREKVGREG